MQKDKLEILIADIKEGLAYAEKKHPVFCDRLANDHINGRVAYSEIVKSYQEENDRGNIHSAEMIIKEELYEMLEAGVNGDWKQAYNESVDTAVTALRAMEFCFNMCLENGAFSKGS